jgi:hypothetical protein
MTQFRVSPERDTNFTSTILQYNTSQVLPETLGKPLADFPIEDTQEADSSADAEKGDVGKSKVMSQKTRQSVMRRSVMGNL